jgi:hypothetical protein
VRNKVLDLISGHAQNARMDTPEIARSCSACRHWVRPEGNELGECRRGWPTPNGQLRAFWPFTAGVDVCGYFAAPAGSGSQAKITDAEIFEMVRTPNGLPKKRAWLIQDMVAAGLAKTSAIERVARMVTNGALCVGLVRPPKLPLWKFEHPAVWLPGFPPDGVDGGGTVDEALADRRPPGRPSYDAEAFMPAVVEAAPSKDRAITAAELRRVMATLVPTIGASTFTRLRSELMDSGKILCEDGLYWAAPAVPKEVGDN